MATCTVDNQGRILLPAKWRQEQGIEPGTELVVLVEEGGYLSIQTREQGIARAQAWVRKVVPPGVSLVDELIAERREEVRREEEEEKESRRLRKARRGKVA